MKNGYYFSKKLNKRVYVELDEDEVMDGCTCDLCGKEMKKAYLVLEDGRDCEEYYGSCCIKTLELVKEK